MTRTLALALFLVVVASAEALAQRTTTRSTELTRAPVAMIETRTVEDRLQSLESEVDQLTADLQQARQRADEAKSEAASLRQRLDTLTAAITVTGHLVKVDILQANTVMTESVVAENYTPGAGNIW